MNGNSLDISEENRARLKALFPSVFTETVNDKGEPVESVDFEKLKAELGTFTDFFENRRERYGMDWPGKKDALRLIQTPSAATLKPCRDESVNFDTTENLFIEGDNLEVLKLLQKSYYGKVKMICIDPPYNTGKEFIYPDNFTESLQTYLEYAGLVDGDGKKFSTNTATEGRFHTKWLNMMYPRLYLARNLLRDDGVIFIHIDDNEVSNLRKTCDEIFGEENFVAQFTLLCNPKGRAQDKHFATNHEYIIVYSKNQLPKGSFNVEKDSEQLEIEYTEEDETGKYRTLELRNTHREFGKHNRKNLYYPIFVDPTTGEVQLNSFENGIEVLPNWDDGFEGCWTWGKPKADVEVEFLTGRKVNGKWKIYVKDYASGASKMLKTILIDKGYFTEKGQKSFNTLFEAKKKIFQSPKSSELLLQLLKTSTIDSDLILDFFAGSATTAHAVLDLNKQDGGNRKFILVQLPEPCAPDSEAFKAGYKTIADIGKERIRRVIKKLNDEQKGKLDFKGMSAQDRGFKVLKLNKSNFKQWQNLTPDAKPELIQKQLFEHIDHIDHKATPEDLLYEILIKAGFTPTEKVEILELKDGKLSRRDAEPQRKETGKSMVTEKGSIEKATVSSLDSSSETSASPRETLFSIADGGLLICLADAVTKELINAVAEAEPMQFICLDSAFGGNDQLKANAVQTFNARNQGREKANQIIFKTI